MQFRFSHSFPHNPEPGCFYLIPSTWDDFGHKTTFYLIFFDKGGAKHSIGDIKIAHTSPQRSTSALLKGDFEQLDEGFYSLGQSPEYYEKLHRLFPNQITEILHALKDVANDDSLFGRYSNERAFSESLTRGVSAQSIKEQFNRIIREGTKLAKFDFVFHDPRTGLSLSFMVSPEGKPPSNIHILTGSNGTGKTRTLQNLAQAVTQPYGETLLCNEQGKRLRPDYFSRLVYASFSIYDNPLATLSLMRMPALSTSPQASSGRDVYLGLYTERDDRTSYDVVNKQQLAREFATALEICLLGSSEKKASWERCITILEADRNFEESDLRLLMEIENRQQLRAAATTHFEKLSSGHAAVLYTITALVDRIEEKSLLLFDEPENHLHPPLLSAFLRAISELLNERNGIAILSTHSPIVLQEVPRACVWKLSRNDLNISAQRPKMETFAENIGKLTGEVFNLEIQRSGFHAMLKEAVENDLNYEEIVSAYKDQIGFEGRAVLRALLASRRH